MGFAPLQMTGLYHRGLGICHFPGDGFAFILLFFFSHIVTPLAYFLPMAQNYVPGFVLRVLFFPHLDGCNIAKNKVS